MKWLVKQHFPLSAIAEAKNFQETFSDLPKKNYDLVVLDAEIADNAHLQIGRAHVCTPVTNAHLVCCLLLEKKNRISGDLNSITPHDNNQSDQAVRSHSSLKNSRITD